MEVPRPMEDRSGGPFVHLIDDAAIDAIQVRVAALPVLDTRSDEEIIGYDENGLPT
jgi:hypothetical protein